MPIRITGSRGSRLNQENVREAATPDSLSDFWFILTMQDYRTGKREILPPTASSLSTLAKISGDDRCVMTIYFPGSRSADKKTRAELIALPERILGAECLTRDEDDHRQHSLEIWRAEITAVALPPTLG